MFLSSQNLSLHGQQFLKVSHSYDMICLYVYSDNYRYNCSMGISIHTRCPSKEAQVDSSLLA